MRQRLLAMCLLVGCVVFAAAAVVITYSQDKTVPVITIGDKEKEVTYYGGDDYEELLAGVTAKDNRDGDVTDKIFVDSIIPVSDGSKAIVRYAVIDKSNNVGIKTRIVNYADASQKVKDENEQEIREETATKTEVQEEQEELTPDGVKPAIRLTETSKTIKVGENFDALSVIDQIVDDVDDTSTLYRRIHADGEYDTSTPGTYTIRYYVMDTNNNTSNIEEFTLKVQ